MEMGIKPSKYKPIFYNLQLPNHLNIKIFLLLTPEFLKFTYPTKQNFYFQKISLSRPPSHALPHALPSSFTPFLPPRSRPFSLLAHALGNTSNQLVTQSISPSPYGVVGSFLLPTPPKLKGIFLLRL